MPALIEEETHQVLAWEGDKATLGRAEDNTLLVFAAGVSRYHCLIVKRQSQYFLVDLGGKNGTSLNGHKLENAELPLKPGDRLQVGAWRARFELKVAGDEPGQPKGQMPKKIPVSLGSQAPPQVHPNRPDAPVTVKHPVLPPSVAKQAAAFGSIPAKLANPTPAPAFAGPASEDPVTPIGFVDKNPASQSSGLPAGGLRKSSLPGLDPVSQNPMGQERRTGQILCPKCASANLPGSTVCWNCKTPLPRKSVPAVVADNQRAFGGACHNCRGEYPAGSLVCPHCGSNLSDPRVAFAAHLRASRQQFLIVGIIILGLLSIAACFTYFFIFPKKEPNAADISETERYQARLDRAQEWFQEAEKQEKRQAYERAHELYRDALATIEEIVNEPAIHVQVDARRRAERLQIQFQEKLQAYQQWLEANLKSIRSAQAHEKEASEQRNLGRALFHGGWIKPDEASLQLSGQALFFPEEETLKNALAQTPASPAAIDPLLHAFLQRAWSFQEKYHLHQRLWQTHSGSLPEPVQTVTGARGTRYPQGITAAQFPGVYLARLPFSSRPALTALHVEQQGNKALIRAVFLDNFAEIEAATKATDILTLSRNAKLVCSKVFADFSLPCTPENYSQLVPLAAGDRPPILQIFYKVKAVEAQSSSSEVPHLLPNDVRMTQTLARHEYNLSVDILESRWFRPLPGKDPLYLPVFPQEEPNDWLYQTAFRALKPENGNSHSYTP